MRFAVDTGGTFTDLVIETEDGVLGIYKSPTTPANPVDGVLRVFEVAASALGPDVTARALLKQGELLIHATTRALNAVLTGSVAKTAFLTTQGHPDILVFREGGRTDPFNWANAYPDPYVPRALTYEIPERIGADGQVVAALDEQAVVGVLGELAEQGVEAVGVALLWSIVNPAHETRVGELIERHLPGVPYTLSHRLNPSLREYRRASSTVIDASLKPVMAEYFSTLERRLKEAGFAGRVLSVTSIGGVAEAEQIAAAPIHALGSGPAMAPVAGRHYAQATTTTDTVVVADAGGTSYDVSLVRRGQIPWTREQWIGRRFFGHMTGFPSVDVTSIGAGGGSIAWVDEGALLRVGPSSAGADPGPVCYGRGGQRPTVTDASLVLGYLDSDYFLGGKLKLDRDAATRAIAEVARELDLEPSPGAAAILKLATENMARAIEEITLNQGIDPRSAVLLGGGGAAGLNAVEVAKRLGCRQVVIPGVAAVLSAAGALLSDLMTTYSTTFITTTAAFDTESVNRILGGLEEKCRAFAATTSDDPTGYRIEMSAEARYPSQVWELEVPLRATRFSGHEDVARLRDDYHAVHREVFAVDDQDSEIEIVTWRATVRCPLRAPDDEVSVPRGPASSSERATSRRLYFSETGWIEGEVHLFQDLEPEVRVAGPAIIESPVTTVVLSPGSRARGGYGGSLVIDVKPAGPPDHLDATHTTGANHD